MRNPDILAERRRPLLVLGVVLLACAIAIVILLTGGSEKVTEPRGDIDYIQGSSRRIAPNSGELAASVADIVGADVRMVGENLLLEAEVAAQVPARLDRALLELRWQLMPVDGSDWTVSATLVRGFEGAISSSTGYGSGTVDGSMPGTVKSKGNSIMIALHSSTIEGFPDAFEWRLFTLLRVVANDPDSDRVEDVMPDQGRERFSAE